MAFCKQCGAQLADGSAFCAACGAAQDTATPNPNQNQAQGQPVINNYYINNNNTVSTKSRLVALLLCIFVGGLGVHRFYAGKVGTGILWLFTGGCFGIGYLVDIIMIACGSFTDSYGHPITNWNA